MSTTGIPTPPPPAPAPSGGHPTRRLVRLTDQGKVAGVAAGIGWYTGIDPTLVRIGLIVLTLTTGVGIPMYALAWWLMPASTTSQTPLTAPSQRRDGRSLLIAAIAIVAVTGLLGQIDVFGGRTVLAAILIGLGILLFNDQKSVSGFAAPAPPTFGAPQWTQPPSAFEPPAPPVPPGAPNPPRPPQPQSAFEPYAAAWTPRQAGDSHPRMRTRKHPKSYLGRLTFGLWVLVLSVAAVLSRFGVLTLNARGVLGITVATVGLGLLVGTVFGRSRGLIVIGLLGTLLLVGVTALDVSNLGIDNGVGARSFLISSPDDLDRDFDWSIGETIIDLTDLQLNGEDASFSTSILAGEVRITVPDDITVLVDGSLQAGQASIFGEMFEGTGLTFDVDDPVQDSDGTLAIRLDGLVGEINVDRQGEGTLTPPDAPAAPAAPEGPR